MTKFFRVALEGATTDGRKIERAHIEQAAARYNPATYAARVWIEHFRSLMPEGPFSAQGDVLALKAEEVEIEGQKRMALFAQIEPLPSLLSLANKAKQKLYTSIELDPNFAASGQAYVVGLGVTDNPASLGTERLAFAAEHPQTSPFAALKQNPANLFTAGQEVMLDFTEAKPELAPSANAGSASLTDAFTALFGPLLKGFSKSAPATETAPAAAAAPAATTAQPGPDFAQIMQVAQAFANLQKQQADSYAALQQKLTALEQRFDVIDKTEASNFGAGQGSRPQATGASTGKQTDC